MGRVAIKQPEPPAEEVPTEVLASAITSIADGVTKLRSGRLNDRALLLLIQHACPSADRPSVSTIRAVLDAIEGLKAQYLKKPSRT